MREFELTIDEALNNGLSPRFSIPSNSPFLWECLGFRCGDMGLEKFIEGENPLPNTIDMQYAWPFPQFLQGELYNLLVVRDNTVNYEDVVYSISDDYSTVTQIAVIDQLSYGSLGTLVEVADFGEYAMFVNGISITYWDVTGGVWHTVDSHTDIPLMKTICNFKGQAVGGGVKSTWHDCDETYYVWSKIGDIDFTPDQNNEAGYRRCPFGGDVQHTRRLGDAVIGYSSKGITLLFPVTEPVPSFGFKELIDIGIHNQGAMNGNQFKQVYVGTDLKVREVTNEGIKELGYEYWMDQLDDDSEDIIVSFDKSKGDFYIGNSTKTFLLTSKGMTEIPQHPSAVWRDSPDEVYLLPETVDDFYPLITTEVIDFGYRGQKTLATIETDAVLGTNIVAGADYAFDIVNWGSTVFSAVNNMGIGTVIAAGNMFRLKIRFDMIYDAFRIGYVKTRYKMTDMRGMRGVYAPNTNFRGQR